MYDAHYKNLKKLFKYDNSIIEKMENLLLKTKSDSLRIRKET